MKTQMVSCIKKMKLAYGYLTKLRIFIVMIILKMKIMIVTQMIKKNTIIVKKKMRNTIQMMTLKSQIESIVNRMSGVKMKTSKNIEIVLWGDWQGKLVNISGEGFKFLSFGD